MDENPAPNENSGGEELNSYEATIKQQEIIEKEVRQQPLLTKPLDLDDLLLDFANHDIYLRKLELIKKQYKKIRRLRRDGNCFYRAFAFGYLEYLVNKKDQSEMKRLKDLCTARKDDLLKLGYTQFTIEDFYEQFVEKIDAIADEQRGISYLEEIFNDQGHSDYVVVFMRLMVSGYLQVQTDFFQNFIDNQKTIKEFCSTEVEPCGHESDHIHIIALTQALEVCIRVEYMDQTGDVVNCHVFPETGTPVITLLYRPGHYDILYA